MLIGEINFTGIVSDLERSFHDFNDNEEDIKAVDLPYGPSDILDDFNKRNINPKNINEILSLCDYLLIQDTLNFVVNNALLTYDPYILTEEHEEHYDLPIFMSDLNYENVVKYNYTRWLHFVDTYEVVTYDVLQNAVDNNMIECVKYIYYTSETSNNIKKESKWRENIFYKITDKLLTKEIKIKINKNKILFY